MHKELLKNGLQLLKIHQQTNTNPIANTHTHIHTKVPCLQALILNLLVQNPRAVLLAQVFPTEKGKRKLNLLLLVLNHCPLTIPKEHQKKRRKNKRSIRKNENRKQGNSRCTRMHKIPAIRKEYTALLRTLSRANVQIYNDR